MTSRTTDKSAARSTEIVLVDEIKPADLSALDLRMEAEDVECRAYRVTLAESAERAEVLYVPELDRAGVVHGADAVWTDVLARGDANAAVREAVERVCITGELLA